MSTNLLDGVQAWEVELLIACSLEGIDPNELPWSEETSSVLTPVIQYLESLGECDRYSVCMKWLSHR